MDSLETAIMEWSKHRAPKGKKNSIQPCFTCGKLFKVKTGKEIYCRNPCDSGKAHRIKFNVHAIIADNTPKRSRKVG
jgi:hypothetical protein